MEKKKTKQKETLGSFGSFRCSKKKKKRRKKSFKKASALSQLYL